MRGHPFGRPEKTCSEADIGYHMGIVSRLYTDKADIVMGIDASTHSLAFAVFDGERLLRYGKIYFEGNTSYERLADSQRKVLALNSQFNVDYIAIEKAIMVKSVDTTIKMGMAIGVIIASVVRDSTRVVEVAPVSWQSFIGNKNYSRAQKGAVKNANPGRSDSWIKNFIRESRKQYTIDFFNKKFGIYVDDNDVSDAIGIAWYAVNHLTHG
jgi:Holliday junction resolvasome RuvABC endonuclease subunit